ncbi:Spo7-like protein-domain-containing protein [Apiospora arundinis]
MADSVDSIVKGAPSPAGEAMSKSPPTGTSPIASGLGGTGVNNNNTKPGDPLHHTPSSPSMIYLNMLILEASLRAQYLELRTRRRKHTFFLGLLSIWVTGFGYALFFAPREDGVGVGGSVYWVVDMTEKVCFMAGIVTALLVWATGIWDRGVRWPRRWFFISNRGLRGFNCKLVVAKRSWLVEAMSALGFFITYGAFSKNAGQYRFVEPSILREVEKELKLSHQDHPLCPSRAETKRKGDTRRTWRPVETTSNYYCCLSPSLLNFRENWELYRAEYWERENERRALLRHRLQQRDKEFAKQQSRWFWWLPGRQQKLEERMRQGTPLASENEKSSLHHRQHSTVMKEHRRTRSGSVRRASTSAGSTSRGSTPTIGVEAAADGPDSSSTGGGGAPSSRRGSNASTASTKGRVKRQQQGNLSSGGSVRSKRPSSMADGRSLTPDYPSPLARESSVTRDDDDNKSVSGHHEGGGGTGRNLRKKASRSSVASH